MATKIPKPAGIPTEIQTILNKPIYKNATWGLLLMDLRTRQILMNLNGSQRFFIGSIRKLFSVGELLDKIGPNKRFFTTVHYDGSIKKGELQGNLVLVASGDFVMGGRTKTNGTMAITDLDHNEADALGNAILTDTDPLDGYNNLAKQVKKAGIKKITGNIIIDDRLFEPFNFRDQFDVSPIFVNDDVVDVIINPNPITNKFSVDWRPRSAAFSVIDKLSTVGPNNESDITVFPELPQCIGISSSCEGIVKGQLSTDFIPPLTNQYPLIKTFRITAPANYARTVFIEMLKNQGVDVSNVKLIAVNPTHLLKNKKFYNRKNQIALFQSFPYKEYAKLVLKVSYNLGADMSLMLFGLTQGVNSMQQALLAEQSFLANKYGLSPSDYQFVDGSGGGDTKATGTMVLQWLMLVTHRHFSQSFFESLPILGVDGSLALINQYQNDPTLKGATGNIFAKTGTYITLGENGELLVKGQGFAGYIHSKNGRQLAYILLVNNATVQTFEEFISIIQDQGIISAMLWRKF